MYSVGVLTGVEIFLIVAATVSLLAGLVFLIGWTLKRKRKLKKLGGAFVDLFRE